VSADVVWHPSRVSRAGGATVWLTGLPASGKSTLAVALEDRLEADGRAAYLLDGDNLRHGLNAGLGFSDEDRAENVRRVGEVAKLFADAGLIAVVSLVSPFRAGRDAARAAHAEAGLPFLEVWVDTPVEECARRDPKGLYARAREGTMTGLTGVDAPYEPPTAPELVVHGATERPEAALLRLLEALGGAMPRRG
jgi:bifunctional enzyme CysN/CysC